MPQARLAIPLLLLSALVVAASPPAGAQAPRPGQPAPPKPYKLVPVTLVQPYGDPSFEAFRKQLADIASRKDRAALARLVVARNFFWMGEKGDRAEKRKSGIDNLAAAISLDAKDGSGWETLAEAAGEATLEPMSERKGVLCAPASPSFDEKAAEQLAKDTGTEPDDWGYPLKPGLEVRAAPQPDAAVIEQLGMHLIRVMPEDEPHAGAQQPESPFIRVVTPSGKVGYALEEALSSLDIEQICYVKEATGWKIAGYAGGD